VSTDPARIRAHSSAPAAQRMRAHRKRRREGSFIVRVQLDPSDVDGFIRLKLLRPGQRQDTRWPCGGSSITCWTGCRLVDRYSNADRLSDLRNAAVTVTPSAMAPTLRVVALEQSKLRHYSEGHRNYLLFLRRNARYYAILVEKGISV
jgi:hypothetical protein